jgi:hypothetical protein
MIGILINLKDFGGVAKEREDSICKVKQTWTAFDVLTPKMEVLGSSQKPVIIEQLRGCNTDLEKFKRKLSAESNTMRIFGNLTVYLTQK